MVIGAHWIRGGWGQWRSVGGGGVLGIYWNSLGLIGG